MRARLYDERVCACALACIILVSFGARVCDDVGQSKPVRGARTLACTHAHRRIIITGCAAADVAAVLQPLLME